MNSTWKKAIHKKHHLLNRLRKMKSRKNWQLYRKQRNLCQKLKRESLRNYMNDKCVNSKQDPREFWRTVSPYLSDKTRDNGNIQLVDGDCFQNNPVTVANIFNDNFVKIADSIGADSIYNSELQGHPSFGIIENHVSKLDVNDFEFAKTDIVQVEKTLKGLNTDKATGYDGISPKVLSANVIAPAICNKVNNIMTQSNFPAVLKRAEVVPIHKAKSRLQWSNYRPVSILSSFSKVCEQILTQQMNSHTEKIFCKYLSAYRKNHGCNSVLTLSTEYWKQAFDDKNFVGIILTDLSKVFDCLPAKLLVEKL